VIIKVTDCQLTVVWQRHVHVLCVVTVRNKSVEQYYLSVNGTDGYYYLNTFDNILASGGEMSRIYSVSQKKSPPLRFSGIFFPSRWEFLVQSLQAYCTFPSTLDYKFLFIYLQL